MPRLDIQLLGRFQVQFDGHPVSSLDHQRLQTLLAYLLLHRVTPIPRRRLAALFWPDSSDSQALTNLRNLVYRLRNALPDPARYLYANSQTIQWAHNGGWQLDVADFERIVTEADATPDGAEACTILADALTSYTGSLLPDHYDDWVVEARERLNQRYQAALLRIIQLLIGRQAYRDALPYAKRLLRDEPLQEAHYRLIMRLHSLNGDRAGVAQTFHACAELLRRELDIEPAHETKKLYDQLREAEEHAAPPLEASAPADRLLDCGAMGLDSQQRWHSGRRQCSVRSADLRGGAARRAAARRARRTVGPPGSE